MMRTFALTVAASAGLATAQFEDLFITELYTGISGEDGSADWIELTNFGTDAITLDGLFFDDASASVDDGDLIPTLTISGGESIILLVDIGSNATQADVDAEIAAFQDVWNTSGVQIFAVDGGGFSQGGDSAFILGADGSILAGATYSGDDTSNFATLEFLPQGNVDSPVLSQVGARGAFESAEFFNDNLGVPNDLTTLVGSPGIVPTPGSIGAFAALGLAAARRRR